MFALTREFHEFLREYKVISLAIGFVMGAASTNLVNSLVKDIIMPLLTPLFAAEPWREAALQIGSVTIHYGSFLAEAMNFLILTLIIFFVVRKVFKLEAGKR